MSDILGKIFGKDKDHKDKSHKDKGPVSAPSSNQATNSKWTDFCEYTLVHPRVYNSHFNLDIH